jgi:hypothetical protein
MLTVGRGEDSGEIELAGARRGVDGSVRRVTDIMVLVGAEEVVTEMEAERVGVGSASLTWMPLECRGSWRGRGLPARRRAGRRGATGEAIMVAERNDA